MNLWQLLQERQSLQEAVRSANEIAQFKDGEIAIIRANQTKLEREHTERVRFLQKSKVEEATQLKAEVEKVRAEQKRVITEKEFLENEIVQENQQIKNLQKAVNQSKKTFTHLSEGAPVTPKKNKLLPYGDGFDDDEIPAVSPAKAATRPKAVTPRAKAKRKRKTAEGSPTKALPLRLSQSKEDGRSNNHHHDLQAASSKAVIETSGQEDDRFYVCFLPSWRLFSQSKMV